MVKSVEGGGPPQLPVEETADLAPKSGKPIATGVESLAQRYTKNIETLRNAAKGLATIASSEAGQLYDSAVKRFGDLKAAAEFVFGDSKVSPSLTAAPAPIESSEWPAASFDYPYTFDLLDWESSRQPRFEALSDSALADLEKTDIEQLKSILLALPEDKASLLQVKEELALLFYDTVGPVLVPRGQLSVAQKEKLSSLTWDLLNQVREDTLTISARDILNYLDPYVETIPEIEAQVPQSPKETLEQTTALTKPPPIVEESDGPPLPACLETLTKDEQRALASSMGRWEPFHNFRKVEVENLLAHLLELKTRFPDDTSLTLYISSAQDFLENFDAWVQKSLASEAHKT